MNMCCTSTGSLLQTGTSDVLLTVNAREDAQRSKHKAFVGNTGLLMDNRQLQKINKKENVIIKLCTTYIYK